MKKHYRKENDCLNCGTILEGKFCHNCGQENLEMKESFGHMLNHAISDYFHFDYQFFHTLRPLFLKPGHLTNEYLAGRRAQYLHPVKMYIFISLVFFVFFFQGNKHENQKVKDEKHSEQNENNRDKTATNKGIYANLDLTVEQKKAIANRLKAYVPDTVAKEIDADIEKDCPKVKVRETDNDGGFTFYGDDNVDKFSTYDDYLANQTKLSAKNRDNMLERYLVKKNYDWKNQGKNAKEVLMEGFKHNAPKMMFLLLPLFALILKIAFWKNHKLYVEHIIYAIHLHCYIFLFLTVIILLNLLLPNSWEALTNILQAAANITIIWYIYRSLRVVYNRSRWRTVSKIVGVSIMYTLGFSLSALIILFITAITSV